MRVKVDTQRAEWTRLPSFPGVEVQVRSINSREAQRAKLRGQNEQMDRRYASRPEGEKDRRAAQIVREMAASCLADWKGVDGDDGKPLPFSHELALEWARDDSGGYFTFFTEVFDAATRIGTEETDAKEAVRRD